VTDSETYVALAYGVFLLVILSWAAIMAAKLARLERESAALVEAARRRTDG
jgi:hypothetical protein